MGRGEGRRNTTYLSILMLCYGHKPHKQSSVYTFIRQDHKTITCIYIYTCMAPITKCHAITILVRGGCGEECTVYI